MSNPRAKAPPLTFAPCFSIVTREIAVSATIRTAVSS